MNNYSAGQFCWNELATHDINKTKDFYSKLLGWQFEDIQTENMTYTLVKTDGDNFAGIWQVPVDQQAQIPPHWMSYILVNDINDTLAKAKQLGGVEIKEVTEVPGMGQFAVITDATGAYVALWQTNR